MDDRLAGALAALRAALVAVPFAAATPERDTQRAQRDRLVADVDGHIERLARWDAPLLVVLGGGTGAGKSTLTNTLVGQSVSRTGVLRPTTSIPTLVANPRDRDMVDLDRLLPGMPVTQATTHALPPGLVLIDAPDVDSVATEHRDLADLLLDAADVWVWLVTAQTYADEAGMAYLRRAAARRTALAVVLSKVHERDLDEVAGDLRRKLADAGLDRVAIHTVPASIVEGERLPARAVAGVREWVHALADPEAREEVRRQTFEGALDDLPREVAVVRAAVVAEREAVERLAAAVDRAFADVDDRFADSLDDGLPLRQEVLARWSDFIGTSRFGAMLESATGMVRSWVRDTFHQITSSREAQLRDDVRSDVTDVVTDLLVDVVELAVAEVAAAWETAPAGRGLLEADPELRRPAPDLRAAAEAEVQAWQRHIVELLETRGAERQHRSRWVSTAINAGATAAIVVTFASTGGLTGVEAGIASAAAAANQALLVRLLGETNIAWLQRQIRADLLARAASLAAGQRTRHDAAIAGVAVRPDVLDRLDGALAAVAEVRR